MRRLTMGKDTLSLFYPAGILLIFTLIQGRVIVLKMVNRGNMPKSSYSIYAFSYFGMHVVSNYNH
jgi:hypothetical protein